MNRFLMLICVLLATACTGASAQGLGGKLKKLLGRGGAETALDTSLLPAPYGAVEGSVALADTLDWGTGPDGQTFVQGMLALVGLAEPGQRGLTSLDVAAKTFGTVLTLGGDEADRKVPRYTCRVRFATNGPSLVVLADSISLLSANFFGEVSATTFEHLNLQKPKSQQQLQEFATLFATFLQALQAAEVATPLEVTHWDDIAAGRPVEGMNESECLLSAGRPLHVRRSSTRTRWMMAGNTTITFVDGRVTRVTR